MRLNDTMIRALLVLGLVWGTALTAPVCAEDTMAMQAVSAYSTGVQAYREGDFERAINYLRRAIALDSGNANARYYLAVALDRLNLNDEAIAQYQYVVAHGSDPNVVAYSRTRLEALAPARPDTELLASASTPSSAALIGSAQRIAVPLKSNRNALMVDAQIINHSSRRATGTFIIDTGATYTSISRDMAEQLGLDLENCDYVRITTANGRIDVPKVTLDRLVVNGLEARNVEATVIDVRKGSSFHGLLGLSFIRQFVLTIDPTSNQLIFQKL